MRAVDRFVDSLRAAIEHALPWYDPAAASGRSRDTERIRRRSIKARLDAMTTRATIAATNHRATMSGEGAGSWSSVTGRAVRRIQGNEAEL